MSDDHRPDPDGDELIEPGTEPDVDQEPDPEPELDGEHEHEPDPDPDADGVTVVETELEDGQLAYDCAAWAGESRGMLTSLLTSAGIVHAWQGTTLTVRDEDEDAVDGLIDEVLAASRPALDPGATKLVYEVGEWPVALQTELADALTAADVPYEWDERGDLVVREEDEDAVAAVLDELPEPDESGISADDGVAVHELFDSLFMTSDRLARHPADAAATVSLVDDAELIAAVALPFGFEPVQWRQLVDTVAQLREAIEGEHEADTDPEAEADPDAEPDAEADAEPALVGDALIAQRAGALRDLLRQYV